VEPDVFFAERRSFGAMMRVGSKAMMFS